jgi:type IV secretion system protein VirB11
MSISSLTALSAYLEPLKSFLDQDGVNEISINCPGEVWVEKAGTMSLSKVSELDFNHLRGMASLIAQSTNQIISEEKPLLSATLPNGYRVQIVLPPACEAGTIVYSIRKPSALKLTLSDYENSGLFSQIKVHENIVSEDNMHLSALLEQRMIRDFIQTAVISKKNIIISGGTSTGKTTFTNAILRSIPPEERLITVEDAREIQLDQHKNRVHLLASKGGQGLAHVDTQSLIEACLRLRPDRIIVGELRGSEAFSFLRAINTGHPGSISTVHADSPDMAIEQLKLMVTQAGLGIPPSEIRHYITQVIDIIIQIKRDTTGKRYLSEIYFRDRSSRNAEHLN